MQVLVVKTSEQTVEHKFFPDARVVFEDEVTNPHVSHGCDLVVLEISRASSESLVLFKKLKELFEHLPIIVVSALDDVDRDLALEFVRNGAADFLTALELSEDKTKFRLHLAVEKQKSVNARYGRIEMISSLLEQTYDGFILLDADWQITYCSEQCRKSLGWTAADAVGKHLSMIIPRHLRRPILRKLKVCTISNSKTGAKAVTEVLVEHSSGRCYPAELGIAPIDKPEGEIEYAVYLRDISKQKKSKEKLEKLVHERTEMLIQNNEELRQFAKVASHDLQEPLRAVQGFAELLQRSTKGKLDSNCDEFIDFILDGTQRMSKLIQSILAHAQINYIDCSEHPTDCNSVLSEVLNDLRASLDQAQVSFDIEPLPDVAVERSQMIQLFQNLISNSIKYKSSEPLLITISAKKTVSQWLFSISDNGIGIEPQYAQKIFDMFSRLHSKGKYPGTGIGLAICKRIVTLHGGNIWVESNLGQGSIFMFTLPVLKVKENKKMAMAKPLDILLVEDTPSDVRLTQEALKNSALDFSITVATDGEEALAYLRRIKAAGRGMPHLILLDLNMPRKNGHEVLEEIKADPVLQQIPVVLLTVSESDEDILKALQTKMNYYLPKPVRSENLCALIKAMHEISDDERQDTGTQSREESHIRAVLAGNPHTPLRALAKLADDLSKNIRAKVAENPRLSEELQMQLARDLQPEVRISLCENSKLFASVAEFLSVDESEDVRLALCSSTTTSLHVLELLAKDENVFVSASARKVLNLQEENDHSCSAAGK